jgi:mannose-6-phosphate isomerase-like protein (cupin superfamily)
MTPQATVHVRSAESGDAVSVIELTVDVGFGGPPLHHHDFDEAFYVLEGEMTFRLGDELFTRRAGEAAFAPRGSAHTLANMSGGRARYLLICTPGGFESRFEEGGLSTAVDDKPYLVTHMVGPTIPEYVSSGGAAPAA